MYGDCMAKLVNNPVIEKSVRRLRAMGLNVHILPESDNEAYIFITVDSILKLIGSKIRFPNKKLYIEDNFLVIRVWRV